MTDQTAPYSMNFDLGSVRDSETKILTPTPEQRARIAEWVGLSALDSLTARLRISRLGDNFYACDAHLEADVVQSCVVTLEPVRSHITHDFARRYRVLPARKGRLQFGPAEAVVDPEDDETETVQSPVIDLVAPVLEELSLSIDPYPRAPGAQLEAPEEAREAAPENPFEVLRALKQPKARDPGAKARKR